MHLTVRAPGPPSPTQTATRAGHSERSGGGARALAGLQVNYDEAQKEVTIVADVIHDHQASVEVNALKFGK